MKNDNRVREEFRDIVAEMVDELSRYPVDQLEFRLNDIRAVFLNKLHDANPNKSELACAVEAGVIAEAVRDGVMARVRPLN